jgi:hypothetical protein
LREISKPPLLSAKIGSNDLDQSANPGGHGALYRLILSTQP